MQKSKKSALFAGGFVGFVVLAVAGVAMARSGSPVFFRGFTDADEACIVAVGTSSIQDQCPATTRASVQVILSLEVDSSGSKTVTMDGHVSPSDAGSFLSCASYATDNTGIIVSSGSFRDQLSTTDADWALQSATVPSNGTLNVECNLGPGAQLNSVRW